MASNTSNGVNWTKLIIWLAILAFLAFIVVPAGVMLVLAGGFYNFVDKVLESSLSPQMIEIGAQMATMLS